MFERCWARMLAAVAIVSLAGCGAARPSPQTVTMVIENSPTSLDPRIGVDGSSEHIGSLIFDSLVHKDAHFNLSPGSRPAGKLRIRLPIAFICGPTCIFKMENR